MLTKRQNFLETIRGGKPDRYVKCYEALALVPTPYALTNPRPKKGGEPVVNKWGVTISYPENAPGPFPVHDEEHIVIKDIERWRDFVKLLNGDARGSMADTIKKANEIDRNEYGTPWLRRRF